MQPTAAAGTTSTVPTSTARSSRPESSSEDQPDAEHHLEDDHHNQRLPDRFVVQQHGVRDTCAGRHHAPHQPEGDPAGGGVRHVEAAGHDERRRNAHGDGVPEGLGEVGAWRVGQPLQGALEAEQRRQPAAGRRAEQGAGEELAGGGGTQQSQHTLAGQRQRVDRQDAGQRGEQQHPDRGADVFGGERETHRQHAVAEVGAVEPVVEMGADEVPDQSRADREGQAERPADARAAGRSTAASVPRPDGEPGPTIVEGGIRAGQSDHGQVPARRQPRTGTDSHGVPAVATTGCDLERVAPWSARVRPWPSAVGVPPRCAPAGPAG